MWNPTGLMSLAFDMTKSHLHVFAYDIVHNTRRYRVARLLERHGLRVQKSIFEIRGTRREIVRLAAEAKRQMLPGDSLRVYRIPRASLKYCIAQGGAPIPEQNDFFLF